MSAIDRMLVALNAHDLDAFIACYADDATIEDGYDKVIARGNDGLRQRYGPMFEQHPDVQVQPLLRVEEGEFVIQHEEVTGRGEPTRHVAVYLVRDDHIVRERLIG